MTPRITVCGALFNVKGRLEKGTKAYNSVEAALSAISSKLGDFGKSWMCKGEAS